MAVADPLTPLVVQVSLTPQEARAAFRATEIVSEFVRALGDGECDPTLGTVGLKLLQAAERVGCDSGMSAWL